MTAKDRELCAVYLDRIRTMALHRIAHDQTLHMELRADLGYIAQYAAAVASKLSEPNV